MIFAGAITFSTSELIWLLVVLAIPALAYTAPISMLAALCTSAWAKSTGRRSRGFAVLAYIGATFAQFAIVVTLLRVR